MSKQDGEIRIARRTPESRVMVADTVRTMSLTPELNRLTFEDGDEIRRRFAELTGKPLDDQFRLIPPFFTTCGKNISVGRNVFINQNCTLYDLAPVTIGDDVLIGPMPANTLVGGNPAQVIRSIEGE